MAQKREKDETMELEVPSDTPRSLIPGKPPACPGSTGPDPTRINPGTSDKAAESSSEKESERDDRAAETAEQPRRSDGDSAATTTTTKKALNRCSGCGKRVGLTGFRCRCGDLFCSQHRYSDRHDCSFDYKAAGREAIARENPVVRAAKILKV